MISDYAPIIIFVYNRVNKSKDLINSLLKNYEASRSDLFIFSDGAKNETDAHLVEKQRSYLEEISGFRSVHIIKHEKNKGLAESVIYGVSQVLSLYDKIIVLEDDLVVGKNFLKYMNDSLNRYRDAHQVCSISACSYIDYRFLLPQSYFLPITSSWSWATWADRWKIFDYEACGWERLLEEKRLCRKFDYYNSFPFTKMIIDTMQTNRNSSWAIRWYWSVFCNKGLTLYPRESLCINNGLDGTGTNCRETTRKIQIAYDGEMNEYPSKIKERISIRIRLVVQWKIRRIWNDGWQALLLLWKKYF